MTQSTNANPDLAKAYVESLGLSVGKVTDVGQDFISLHLKTDLHVTQSILAEKFGFRKNAGMHNVDWLWEISGFGEILISDAGQGGTSEVYLYNKSRDTATKSTSRVEYQFTKIGSKHWLAGHGITQIRRHWGIMGPVWHRDESSPRGGRVRGTFLSAAHWGLFSSFDLTALTWEISGSKAHPKEKSSARNAAELYQSCIPTLERQEDEWINQLSDLDLKGVLNLIRNTA